MRLNRLDVLRGFDIRTDKFIEFVLVLLDVVEDIDCGLLGEDGAKRELQLRELCIGIKRQAGQNDFQR